MTEAMLEQQARRLPDELEGSFQQAADLVANPQLQALLARAAEDPELRISLEEAGPEVLAKHGLTFSDDLDVRFTQRQLVGRPGPDFERYSIRLFNCRTVWVKRDDGKGFEKVEVCLGFEITPHGVSPIG
jgi:hypothetical protein